MASTSNSVPLVVSRFLLACPFLVASATTFALLKDGATAGYAIQQHQPVISAWERLGELGKRVPQEKLVVFLAVTQGMGGFLMVFNHKFGGLLLMLYLLPVTLLTHQFWSDGYRGLEAQHDALGNFLKNVALMGGVLLFMATTDEVPLKVKRKTHAD
ncbi:hypothetical protein PLESTB_000448200 [Pleodorina starrii]|uniref:DoxX family protein n=1 Tax=Pleodorina starrii TaxID=330485 RepID=A0A9W6BFR8_9CHLO|nr:hypothetical protein PLESTM_000672500 [Pleodorina starrii]GLC50935.1 hypothetical protein PLESTB_000448200 [Pleodorina starrii]GLC69869.1 hypothetical protein PLESTF_000889800 [Pleodorina starrii]